MGTTATLDNLMIGGMVCVLVTPLPAKLKKLPESQSVERCGRFRKDLDVEDSGSVTSFASI
jgi:hypothetical protein